VTTEQELIARSSAALDASLELEALTDQLAALDAPPLGSDTEAWSPDEYGGDLDDEPEPAPEGDREGEPESDDGTPGRRGVAHPALSLLLFGDKLRPVVDDFWARAPIRNKLLALTGDFLVERFASALSGDSPAAVADAVRQQAEKVSQNMLVTFVARNWREGWGEKAPDKSVVSRALEGNMARVPRLGVVPLGLFFGLDDRTRLSEQRAEALELLRRWVEQDPGLEDKYLQRRLLDKGHRLSLDAIGRLRRDHLAIRKKPGAKEGASRTNARRASAATKAKER
jgi:hypothetical protein